MYGSAWVFTHSGTAWSEPQELKASDFTPHKGDRFGSCISISGETMVIGNQSSTDNTGAVYVFTRSGGVWTQQQKLVASDAAAGDFFGGSLTIEGDTIVVGANGNDEDTGAAYVFTRENSVWSQKMKLVAKDGAKGDMFGCSVAISDKTILIGAEGKNSNAGAAYAYSIKGH
jgi:hypothetical protein